MMNVTFEHCGLIIAVKSRGRTVIRCRSAVTDLRDDETLEAFVARHGGVSNVAEYLADCLRKAVQS
jgi:hypothetical protein